MILTAIRLLMHVCVFHFADITDNSEVISQNEMTIRLTLILCFLTDS